MKFLNVIRQGGPEFATFLEAVVLDITKKEDLVDLVDLLEYFKAGVRNA